MILYPTETVYGLGVNPLDQAELAKLYQIKGRDAANAVSWLVRSVDDIERYAVLSPLAREIAERHLPGPLTLVLPAKDRSRLLGFRVSSDPVARQVIASFMAEHDAPLTCTSANLSGQPTLKTPQEIMAQLGLAESDLSVVDDGVRTGQPSTVLKVVDDSLQIIRQGSVSVAYNTALPPVALASTI